MFLDCQDQKKKRADRSLGGFSGTRGIWEKSYESARLSNKGGNNEPETPTIQQLPQPGGWRTSPLTWREISVAFLRNTYGDKEKTLFRENESLFPGETTAPVHEDHFFPPRMTDLGSNRCRRVAGWKRCRPGNNQQLLHCWIPTWQEMLSSSVLPLATAHSLCFNRAKHSGTMQRG